MKYKTIPLSFCKFLFALIIILAFHPFLFAQDYTTYYAIVQDLETNLPIDSAHVTLLRDNIPIDSAVTDANGVAILNVPVTGVTSNDTQLPTSFEVQQNYPNPSFQRTNIPFTIARHGDVSYKLYNILGQEVMSGTERLQPGHYQLLLDGLNTLAKGVYILNIATQDNSQSIKMLNLGNGQQPFALTPKIISSNNGYLNDLSKLRKTTQQNLDNLSLRVSKEYYHQQEQAIFSDTTYFALERSHYVISGYCYGVTDSSNSYIPNAQIYTVLSKDTTYSDQNGKYELLFSGTGLDTVVFVAIGYNEGSKLISKASDTVNVVLTTNQIDQNMIDFMVLSFGSKQHAKPDSSQNFVYSLIDCPKEKHKDIINWTVDSFYDLYGINAEIVENDTSVWGIIRWVDAGPAASIKHIIDHLIVRSVEISILRWIDNEDQLKIGIQKEIYNLFDIRDIYFINLDFNKIPPSWKSSAYYAYGDNSHVYDGLSEVDRILYRVCWNLPIGYSINARHKTKKYYQK